MKDDRRFLLGEDPLDPRGVAHVGHIRNDGELRVSPSELLVNLEEVVFGSLDEDQPLRREPGDLAAHFRADASSGAGHQHTFAP